MLGLIVMLFAGLVSCSSDDDDKNIPVEETKVPTTGAIVFLYAATEDELSICDMIADCGRCLCSPTGQPCPIA